MDKQHDKRIRRTRKRLKGEIHIGLLKTTIKDIKLENAKP